MSSLNVTVKAARADISEYVETSAHEQALNLSNLFRRAAMGMEGIEMDVSTASADPVKASGTLTLTSVIATNACTVGKTTFTFTSTPTLSTDVEVDGATNALDATALAAAINAHTDTSKIVVASAASNVVTITALVPGVIGNQIALSSAAGTIVASATYLASGAGGVQSAAVVHNLGHT